MFSLRRLEFMHHPRCAHPCVAFAKLLSLKGKILQASLLVISSNVFLFSSPPATQPRCCVFLAEMVSPAWRPLDTSFVAACKLFLLLDAHVPSCLLAQPAPCQASVSVLWIMHLRRTWKWKLGRAQRNDALMDILSHECVFLNWVTGINYECSETPLPAHLMPFVKWSIDLHFFSM